MMKEVHGLIVAKHGDAFVDKEMRIHVQDSDGIVIICTSSQNYNAALTPDEAMAFARELVLAAKRVAKAMK